MKIQSGSLDISEMTMVANANNDFVSQDWLEDEFDQTKSKDFKNNFVISEARPKKKFRKVV